MPLPPRPKRLRVIGFDDAPHRRARGAAVPVAGVVCRGTRFEGLLWCRVRRDGWNATRVLAETLRASKYHAQVHAVLLDGVAFGGFNVVDLPALAEAVELPCLTVMRRAPDLPAMERAMERLPRPERRRAVLRRAGPVHARPPFWFQGVGLEPDEALDLLERVTDTGHVPEALRIAHLIGSGVVDGESRGRA